MTVAQSVKSRIVDNVVARLQAELVARDDGFYPARVAIVRRGVAGIPNVDGSPTLVVNGYDEAPYEEAGRGGRSAGGGPAAGIQNCRMLLSIGCWLVRDGDTADTYMHDLATCIHVATVGPDGSERYMGGLAINTLWTRTQCIQVDATSPIQYLSVEFSVWYRTAYGRPDVQV